MTRASVAALPRVQRALLVTCLRRFFPAGDFDGAPVVPTEGRRKRKRAVRIEGPPTLFFIFGNSDGWWSKTSSHGDGANVDPAARLVCVAFGSWRLVSRDDESNHESEVRMRDSAELLVGRFAPHFLLFCTSLVAKLEAPCVANPCQDIEGLLADAGDASVLVHDGGLFTTRQQPQRQANTRTSKPWGKTKSRETKMQAERMTMSQIGVFGRKPQSYQRDLERVWSRQVHWQAQSNHRFSRSNEAQFTVLLGFRTSTHSFNTLDAQRNDANRRAHPQYGTLHIIKINMYKTQYSALAGDRTSGNK